jgi:hypothetical protein
MSHLVDLLRKTQGAPRGSLANGVRVLDQDAQRYWRGSHDGSYRAEDLSKRMEMQRALQQVEVFNEGEAQLVALFPSGMSAYEKLENSIRIGGGYFSEETGMNLLRQINSGASAIDLTFVRAESEAFLEGYIAKLNIRQDAIAHVMKSPKSASPGAVQRRIDEAVSLLAESDALLPTKLNIDEPGVMRSVWKAVDRALLASTVVSWAARAPVAIGRVLATRPMPGAVAGANFAQPLINEARVFSNEGMKKYSALAGREIRTVDDLTDALVKGQVKASQIPVDFVEVNGTRLILNTRTSTALRDAGIAQSEWFGINQTGRVAYGQTTFDDLALAQLRRNAEYAVPGQVGWPRLLVQPPRVIPSLPR